MDKCIGALFPAVIRFLTPLGLQSNSGEIQIDGAAHKLGVNDKATCTQTWQQDKRNWYT